MVVGDPITGEVRHLEHWCLDANRVRNDSRRMVDVDTATGSPALNYYTSGTTEPPKGIILGHRAVYASRQQAYCWLDTTPQPPASLSGDLSRSPWGPAPRLAHQRLDVD
jgi:acyl-coenzyme A synthetase/AMP-(fatty) acid ligase